MVLHPAKPRAKANYVRCRIPRILSFEPGDRLPSETRSNHLLFSLEPRKSSSSFATYAVDTYVTVAHPTMYASYTAEGFRYHFATHV